MWGQQVKDTNCAMELQHKYIELRNCFGTKGTNYHLI